MNDRDDPMWAWYRELVKFKAPPGAKVTIIKGSYHPDDVTLTWAGEELEGERLDGFFVDDPLGKPRFRLIQGGKQ